VKKLAPFVLLLGLACGNGSGRPMTQDELRMILTAATATEWGLPGLDARAQTITATGEFDGSLLIKCEYDSAKGGKQDLYFVSGAQIYPNDIGLEREFRKTLDAYNEGVARVPGRTIREQADLLPVGQQHFAAFILNEGKPIGNIFMIHRGRVIHTLVVSRVYFAHSDEVLRLFQPMFDASDRFLQTPSR
jgi:hypothetical protein